MPTLNSQPVNQWDRKPLGGDGLLPYPDPGRSHTRLRADRQTGSDIEPAITFAPLAQRSRPTFRFEGHDVEEGGVVILVLASSALLLMKIAGLLDFIC